MCLIFFFGFGCFVSIFCALVICLTLVNYGMNPNDFGGKHSDGPFSLPAIRSLSILCYGHMPFSGFHWIRMYLLGIKASY